MGELIDIEEFSSSKDAWRNQTKFALRNFSWYFPETFEDKDERHHRSINWDKTIRNVYPEMQAIHFSRLNDSLRVKIRRNVRDQCVGDVIFRQRSMEYEKLYRWTDREGQKQASRDKINHGYYLFYFETSGDAMQFALTFSDVVSEIEERHPDRRDIPEEQIADAAANPHGIYEERW